MELLETKVDSREIYRGKIITVHVDTVRLPGGKETRREVVEHPGGVGILALDDQGRVAMVRQYRYPMGRVVREIPAGKREPGEEPSLTARRELQEEVGATAGAWQDLGALLASPGCYGETLYLYLARDLTLGDPRPDEDERLEVDWVPLAELVEECLDGTLQDAKTVAAILKVQLLLSKK